MTHAQKKCSAVSSVKERKPHNYQLISFSHGLAEQGHTLEKRHLSNREMEDFILLDKATTKQIVLTNKNVC